MTKDELRIYMAEYRKRNRDRLNQQARKRYANLSKEKKKILSDKISAYHKQNPESTAQAKKKYYSSERGKIQKKKEELSYVASGKRALAEKRRSTRPLSDARKKAKLAYQLMRRSKERNLDELSKFVLREAVDLAKTRTKLSGIEWHVDHIQPISKGGSSHYTNIQVAPAVWNRKKSNFSNAKFCITNKE